MWIPIKLLIATTSLKVVQNKDSQSGGYLILQGEATKNSAQIFWLISVTTCDMTDHSSLFVKNSTQRVLTTMLEQQLSCMN